MTEALSEWLLTSELNFRGRETTVFCDYSKRNTLMVSSIKVEDACKMHGSMRLPVKFTFVAV